MSGFKMDTEKTKLIVMIGLPASGKSTFIKDNFNNGEKIHSSDALRMELFGELAQDKNIILFDELRRRMAKDLKDGFDVVFDATNVSRRKRTGFLKNVTCDCEKICYFMATPFKLCLEQDMLREESKQAGFGSIKRMYLSIEVPQMYEGWDAIEIVYHEKADMYTEHFEDLFERQNKIDQETPYHTLTIGKHCDKCQTNLIEIMRNKEDEFKNGFWDLDVSLLIYSAKIHDIGKEFTKTYNEEKGHYTYYQHQLVGAYESLFLCKYNILLSDEYTLKIVKYIHWHMQPFFATSEKAKRKFKKIVGERDYELIHLLHKADKLAK